MNKPLTFVAVFIVGAAVMFLFDRWYTLLLGVVIQVAAVVMGAFEIAQPSFLEGDADDDA